MAETRTRVASTAELPPGESRAVMVGGKEIGLFNVGGKVFALDNTCPHQGGPLSDGRLDGDVVACPWHGWQFKVTTGELVMSPSTRQACYPVEVEGSDIFVRNVPA